MKQKINFGIVIPLANEEQTFATLTGEMTKVLDTIQSGTVYFVVDKASKDKTYDFCKSLSEVDKRFITIWGENNRNAIDAYLLGYRVALSNGHDYIIEMDGGLSHDPSALPMFLRVLTEGNECAFGSRFMNGGSIFLSSWKRTFLSKFGTLLASIFLGLKFKDATSGYQGFHSNIVRRFLDYPIRSKAHFYQTEIRYLLRHAKWIEVPIHYRAPSPSVSNSSLKNSLQVLFFYFLLRVKGKAPYIV